MMETSYCLISKKVARGMAQLLRALEALPEDLGSVSNNPLPHITTYRGV